MGGGKSKGRTNEDTAKKKQKEIETFKFKIKVSSNIQDIQLLHS